VPSSLLAQWRAAEERLYPMVMVIPESYERVVRLVGETTVELQLACRDTATLVEEAPKVADRVRRLVADSGYGGQLDFALIGAAACLMRFRQLETETRREQRIRHIAAAVEGGEEWVVLERGTAPTTWPPLPSSTVEMHLASGRAMEHGVTMDEVTGAARFALAEVALDPATGERVAGEGSEGSEDESPEEFGDLQEWRAAIANRRCQIELRH
jgi:hypothetical protein